MNLARRWSLQSPEGLVEERGKVSEVIAEQFAEQFAPAAGSRSTGVGI